MGGVVRKWGSATDVVQGGAHDLTRGGCGGGEAVDTQSEGHCGRKKDQVARCLCDVCVM